MNKRMAKRLVYTHVRLMPAAIWADSRKELNEPWFVQHVDLKERYLVLFHERLHWSVDVHFDSYRNFQQPDYLVLRGQVVVGVPGRGSEVRPLPLHLAFRPRRHDVLKRALEDAIEQQPFLLGTPEVRAVLADDGLCRQWLALAQMDERGGVALPDLLGSRTSIGIPRVFLERARESLISAERMRIDHPLAGD